MANFTPLERAGAGDAAAARDCVAAYGDMVWTIVSRVLNDRREAERVSAAIFSEVWSLAPKFDAAVLSDRAFIALIARRRCREIDRETAPLSAAKKVYIRGTLARAT